ncbi:uncharacterized protein LOC112523890 [Cynara cardunculus var. scolymus]|uniref:uncharacterized protein LOC112523890 n=1 Tax=Cynara cardunculus var. scolymus TaxID=59895 RepID=UPI000D627F4C|nr:uncharacterized protein LOC112523890 [Cynara cardunculus var. scolymus]
MANHVVSRALDPKASPYHKISVSDHLYVVDIPQSYPCYQLITPPPPPLQFEILQPFIAISPYVYDVHLQPSPRKSVPPPSPVSGKKKSIVLTPVPSGPRIPKARVPRHFRRVNKVVRVENCRGARQEQKWRPKTCVGDKETGNDVKKQVGCFEGRRRWKNRSGEYQQVLPLEAKSTSVMIKNIPNKYTRKLLIQTLDNHCKVENEKIKNDETKNLVSAYDFLYLPIDFNHRVNAGFAFVNFTNPNAAVRFRDAFHGKSWNLFDSPKIAEISGARIQGREALVNNCKIMDFTYGSEEDMPVCFDPARDGSGRVHSKMYTVGKFVQWGKIKSGK